MHVCNEIESRKAAQSRAAGDRPGTAEFMRVLEEIGALHRRKTLDYGQDEDALSNIRSSSDVINVSPWAGCVLRISDKMHRLRSFFRRGRVEFDGVEDTLLDIAAYAVIALVLYREGKTCTKAIPSPSLPTTSPGSSTERAAREAAIAGLERAALSRAT